jgi:hypothetical protein
MAQSLAVVVPSYFETFGMVGIEALRAGAALIHTRVGIMAEAMELPNLKLVNVNDVHALAQVLQATLNEYVTHLKSIDNTETSSEFLDNFTLLKHYAFYEQTILFNNNIFNPKRNS